MIKNIQPLVFKDVSPLLSINTLYPLDGIVKEIAAYILLDAA